MKKIVFFVPAIIYALFYGFIIIGVGLSISSLVYAWICFSYIPKAKICVPDFVKTERL